jgi:hypothetical protein
VLHGHHFTSFKALSLINFTISALSNLLNYLVLFKNVFPARF